MVRATAPKPHAVQDQPRGLTSGNDVEDVVREIGPKVRALRAELGLSLQQMAAQAEVSAASIHKIERGEMVPTITTLLKLAAAFRRPVAYLINEQPGDPNDVWHTSKGNGENLATGDRTESQRVSGPSARFRGAATVTQLPAGTEVLSTPQAGEELLYVISGALDAVVEDRNFTLRKGDSLHYLTDRMASMTNSSRTPAEVLRIRLPS